MQKKIRLCVLFGGRSWNMRCLLFHCSMINSLDFDRYELLLVGIDHDGCWANFEAKKDFQSISQVVIKNQENYV